MAVLQSATELKDYCLRRLGSPVINIEIDNTQLFDRIDDAIEYFVERHFDGTTESFYKLPIKQKDVENKYITVPSDLVVVTNILKESETPNIEVMDNFEYNVMDQMNRNGGYLEGLSYYLTMSHLSMIQDMFVKSKLFTHNNATNKLIPQFKLNHVGSSNLLKDPSDISTANWSAINATLTSNDTVVPNGKTIGDTVTSAGAGTFGLVQDVTTDYYVRGLYTAGVTLNPGTYTGQIKISLYDSSDVLVKEKVVLPVANQWNYFYVEGEYNTKHTNGNKVKIETVSAATGAGETFHLAGPSVFKNAIMLVQGYSAIDPEESVDVYNDRWVKKYATAMIKQQWGTNTKKYKGIQMPGGIELSGQQIFDEATQELQKLEEEFSLTYELPVDFYFQ